VPKHRAQRQAEGSGRGVRFQHAMRAARAALVRDRVGATQAGQGGDVDDATERPAIRRPLPRGWLSGALVNPWFAAGTGLVIAAGLALYSPHKVLTFLPNETNPALCDSHSCSAGGKSSGSLATSAPGKPIKANRHAHSRPLDSGATIVGGSRISVHLAVIRQHKGKFVALVTLRSSRKLGSWRLAFSLPGAQIEMVLGAQWQAKGQHGGIASTLLPQGAGADGGGQGRDQGNWRGLGHWQDGSNGRVAQFLIIGTGSAASPTGCVLDGHSCHFSSQRARH
jgi:hypothetical protein